MVVRGKRLLMVAMILTAAACKGDERYSEPLTVLHTEDQNSSYYHYAKAMYLNDTGRPNQASHELQSLKADTSNHVSRSKIHCWFESGQWALIAQLPPEVWQSFSDDAEIQLIRAKTLMQVGQASAAAIVFRNLSTTYPNDEQVQYYAAAFFLQVGAIDRAQAVVHGVLSNNVLKPKHFLFHFLQSKLCLARGEQAQALEHAKKSVALYPRFSKGWLFKAMIEEKLGAINDAISGYKHFLDLVGGDESVEKQVVHLLFSQNRFTEAADQLKSMKRPTGVALGAYYFDLGLIEWKADRIDNALENLKLALENDSHFVRARLMQIEILAHARRFDDLCVALEKWMIHDGSDLAPFKALMMVRSVGIPEEKLEALLERVQKNQKASYLALLALADLQVNKNEHVKALKTYRRLLAAVPAGEMRSRVWFQFGYTYHALNQSAKAERALKKALECDPVYPSAYNLLAYHYAKEGRNLDAALELAEKAVRANPLSPYYLDTKGYILSKLGRIPQAASVLKRAHALAPGDMVIKEHLAQAEFGDISLTDTAQKGLEYLMNGRVTAHVVQPPKHTTAAGF